MRLSRGYGAVDPAERVPEDSHHKTAPSPFQRSALAAKRRWLSDLRGSGLLPLVLPTPLRQGLRVDVS
jgi:hypothetical protein